MSDKGRCARDEIAVRELSEALKAAYADGRAGFADRVLTQRRKRRLATEACLAPNPEALLQRDILLAVLLRRPDEQAGDEHDEQQDEHAAENSLCELHG
jgi:hypothetical protein